MKKHAIEFRCPVIRTLFAVNIFIFLENNGNIFLEDISVRWGNQKQYSPFQGISEYIVFWRAHTMRDEEQKKENNEILVGANFRNKIIEMLEEIENPVILMKIYTVVRTHLKILREKEQG